MVQNINIKPRIAGLYIYFVILILQNLFLPILYTPLSATTVGEETFLLLSKLVIACSSTSLRKSLLDEIIFFERRASTNKVVGATEIVSMSVGISLF